MVETATILQGGSPDGDAFIELLRKNGFMVQIKRRRHYKTTDSNHHYRKYDNLKKEKAWSILFLVQLDAK